MAVEFHSRILLKHDTAENWAKATNFIPKLGEIIIYDTPDYPRIKIGNNSSNVNDLPFITDNYLALTGGVKLAAGDDLNNCTTPGNYIAGNSAIASGVTNAPITSAGFKCTTFGGYIANRVTQIATTNTANIYFRQYNGTSWSDWAHLYDMDGLATEITALENEYNDHIHSVNEFTTAGSISETTVTQTGTVSSTFTGESATTAASTSKVSAAKGDHVHSYTPAGTVSQPVFEGTQGTSTAPSNKTTSVANTSHTHTYTPTGTVSQPTFAGSAKNTGTPSATQKVYSITGVGAAASLSAAIANKKMTLSWTANTVPSRSEVTVASSEHTHSFTPEGTVSQPTFSGTASLKTSGPTGSVSVPSTEHTHNFTPGGTVTQPTFTGTASSVAATATTSRQDVSTSGHTHTVTAKGSVSSTFSGDAIKHKHTFTGTKISTLKTGKPS